MQPAERAIETNPPQQSQSRFPSDTEADRHGQCRGQRERQYQRADMGERQGPGAISANTARPASRNGNSVTDSISRSTVAPAATPAKGRSVWRAIASPASTPPPMPTSGSNPFRDSRIQRARSIDPTPGRGAWNRQRHAMAVAAS